jgi:putative transposase
VTCPLVPLRPRIEGLPFQRRPEQTYYRWKAKYGGMELSEIQRLKQVEDENRRLKQIVAEQTLDIQALKAVVAKKW